MSRRLPWLLLLSAQAALAGAGPQFDRFDQWAQRYRTAAAESRPSLVAEGVSLAAARRAAMAELIRSDPAQALAHTMKPAGLPAEVAQLLEERVAGSGQLQVLGFLTRAHVPGLEYRFTLGARRLHFLPLERGLTSGPATFEGIALDGWAAVRVKSHRRPRNPTSSLWTTGSKKLLLMRVDFPDHTGAPISDADAANLLATENSFWKANSYNKLNVTSNQYTTVLRLPRNKSDYANSNDDQGLLDDARTAAHNAGYTGYDFEVVAFSSIPQWGWAGLGFVGMSGAWLNGAFDPTVIEHETGHNLGFEHANFWQASGDSVIGNGSSQEYGNVFDVMGSGTGHYNAWYKWYSEWFGTSEVQLVAAPGDSGTFRLYDLEASTLGGVHAIRVPLSSALDYWLEYRPNGGSGLDSRLVVEWGYGYDTQANLLDMTPWTADASDAPLQLGRTFADGAAGIYVTPVQVNPTTTPKSLDVVVNRGLFPGNAAPQVSLGASATTLSTGQQVTLTATATDADGDPLAYWWVLGDGKDYPNASSLSTSFNYAQDVTASVIVSDLKGGFGSAFVVLKVGAPGTYRVSGAVKENGNGVVGVRVFAAGHQVFTDSAGNYTLTGLVGGSTTVQALAPGYTLTPGFSNPLSVSGNLTNIDFNASRATYTLSGNVTSVGQAVVGATVGAGTYTTLTDSSGHYNLNGVPNGAYNLSCSLAGSSAFVPQGFVNPVVVQGASQSGLNFYENVWPVSGEVTGLAGPHTVSDGTHTAVTALSGGHWLYTLPKVPPGNWNLFATASGQVITPSFSNPVSVTGAALTGMDFTASAGTGWLVTGHVDEAGAALQGVTVSDGTRAGGTDSNGDYVLVGVPDGAYTLTPAKAGYQFSPATLSLNVAGADSTGNDFGVLNANAPPTIAIPPHANPSLVKGTQTQLTVLGADPVEGEAALTYTWSLQYGPASVSFSPNGTNAAKGTTATFTQPGPYTMTVTVTDGGGKTASASITLVVVQDYATVTVLPNAPMVQVGNTQQFVAQVVDQFGGMVDFGGEATWSIDGGGSISASGKLTATQPGDFTVTASVMGVVGTTPVHLVVGPVPHLTTGPTATPNPVTGATTQLSVLADDDMGEAQLTYAWTAVQPPAAVAFSASGTNAAKDTVATFTRVGTYNLQVEVTDAQGLSASGFVTVVVQGGGLVTVNVTPQGATVMSGERLQFSASGTDLAGSPVTLSACNWSTTTGAVDGNGLLTASIGPASGDVTATCDGVSGSASLTVLSRPLDTEMNKGGKGCGCGTGVSAPWALLALMWFARLLSRRERVPRRGG